MDEQPLEVSSLEDLAMDNGVKYVSRCFRYIFGLDEQLRESERVGEALIDKGSSEISGCSW